MVYLSAGELVRILRQVFTSYSVAEEFTSDGATVFTGHVFEEFCKMWGVRHRVSSAHHPHSNLWAEVAVRTIKRFAADCTGPGCTVDMDTFPAAMLQYRSEWVLKAEQREQVLAMPMLLEKSSEAGPPKRR